MLQQLQWFIPMALRSTSLTLLTHPDTLTLGGDVTRAMRAVDGAIIVVDSVEGVMPQTETVIRQALKEKVKPVLFINKVDRLINELKLNGDEMQKRFLKIITDVNKLLAKYGPEEFKQSWQVNVQDGLSINFIAFAMLSSFRPIFHQLC